MVINCKNYLHIFKSVDISEIERRAKYIFALPILLILAFDRKKV